MNMPVQTRRHHVRAVPEAPAAPAFSFWLFIEALQNARGGQGMAPKDLAEEMGASHEAVARWMSGIAVPKPGYLKQAARILGVDESELYE